MSIKYRPDIDGLRAIAVLTVVFFHAGFDVFSGGFIGVDIFFVISGFLITSIILEDLDKDRFSIKVFYERRIRRILPALYTVCFVSLIVAVFLLLPDELNGFGKSIFATLLFVSNILFWSEAGYFDASADLKPLLHTWSLAVEEQFYVLFPLLLIFVHRFLNRKYVHVLVIVSISSLLLSAWGADHKPSATFYWSPTRAWELLLGALIACNCLPILKAKWQSEIIGWVGVSLICYAVFIFDYDTSFPGLNALYPCLGTALLIYANQCTNTFWSRVLSLKILVFIGLCSYSFYLWHWPVFVFAKYLSAEPVSAWQSVGLICLSFILAVLTLKFVESPFRNRDFLKGRWRIFVLALLGALPLFIGGLVIIAGKGFPQRFNDIERLKTYIGSSVDKSCVDIPFNEFESRKCIFGDKIAPKTSFVVWGDSHAGAIVRGIGQAAKGSNKSGYLASFSGCPPLLDIKLARDKKPYKCKHANQAILSSIKAGDIVFLVARWTYYTHKSPINKEGPTWINDAYSHDISEAENFRVLSIYLDKTIQSIKDIGAVPIVVDVVPEFPRSVPEMFFLFGKDVMVSKDLFLEGRKDTSSILKNISVRNGVEYIDPSSILCEHSACFANRGEDIYYLDNDHVNLQGAIKLAPLFEPYF